MTREVDPGELDDLARHHRAQAAELRQEARTFLAQANVSEWQGPAANRFRSEAQAWLRSIEHTAADLEGVAAELHREAENVRTELRELARIEAAVRAAAANGNLAVAATTFPPTGDPAWRDLGRRAGIN